MQKTIKESLSLIPIGKQLKKIKWERDEAIRLLRVYYTNFEAPELEDETHRFLEKINNA